MSRLFLSLFCLFLLGAPLRAEPVSPLWETSRLAAAMRKDMAKATPDDLVQLVHAFRERLVLTPVIDGVTLVTDLELALRLAVTLQMRREIPASSPTPAILAAERDAAFVLHAVGFRYETVEDVRFAVDSLASDPQGRPLVDAIRGIRAYGLNWFRESISALESLQALDADSLLQLGVVAMREQDLLGASQFLSKANTLNASPHSLRLQCDALLAAGSPELRTFATELRDRLVVREPLITRIFDTCFGTADAKLQTEAFEKGDLASMSVTDLHAQVERYINAGRFGAAELLAKQLRERDPTAADRLLATIYFSLSRWESLRTLFAEVERDKRFDAHMREVRRTARVGLAAQEALGAERHPLGEGDVMAELRAEKAPTLLTRGQILMILTARHFALAKSKDGRDEKAIAAAEKDILANLKTLLDKEGKNPEALKLAFGVMIAIERGPEGVALIEKKLSALPREARLGLEQLLAKVELGGALLSGDGTKVEKAIDTLGSKIKNLENQDYELKASLLLFQVVGKLSAMTFARKVPPPDALAWARSNLESIAWKFDTSTAEGLELEQARTLTLGTLGILSQDPAAASHYFRLARSLRADSFGHFGGAMASLLVNDGIGAFEQCQRIGPGERPAFAHLVATCRATGLIRGGGDPKTALEEVLSLWPESGIPDTIGGRPSRPIFTGMFNLSVGVSSTRPALLSVETRPVILLLPELVSDKKAIEDRLQ